MGTNSPQTPTPAATEEVQEASKAVVPRGAAEESASLFVETSSKPLASEPAKEPGPTSAAEHVAWRPRGGSAGAKEPGAEQADPANLQALTTETSPAKSADRRGRIQSRAQRAKRMLPALKEKLGTSNSAKKSEAAPATEKSKDKPETAPSNPSDQPSQQPTLAEQAPAESENFYQPLELPAAADNPSDAGESVEKPSIDNEEISAISGRQAPTLLLPSDSAEEAAPSSDQSDANLSLAPKLTLPELELPPLSLEEESVNPNTPSDTSLDTSSDAADVSPAPEETAAPAMEFAPLDASKAAPRSVWKAVSPATKRSLVDGPSKQKSPDNTSDQEREPSLTTLATVDEPTSSAEQSGEEPGSAAKSAEDAEGEASDLEAEEGDPSQDAIRRPAAQPKIPLQAAMLPDHETRRATLNPLTPKQQALRTELRKVLDHYRNQTPNVAKRNPWEIMHWIIAYGHEAQVFVPGRTISKTNAINWLCWNRTCLNEPMFEVVGGLPTPRKGKKVQGHHGQLLAILAQSHTPAEYPIHLQGQTFTVEDVVKAEQLGCEPNAELTFKLIGLSHYLPDGAEWKDAKGRDWNLERVLYEEIEQPINGAACGGTHRLMGIAYAVEKHQAQGGTLTGEYYRGQEYIKNYHEYTYTLLNPNGSFSTDWFKQPAMKMDEARWLQTTGHILEWLNYTLPEDQLTHPRHVMSVTFLTQLLDPKRNQEWSIGTLGHGLRALRLYDERVFQPHDPQPKQVEIVVVQPPLSVRADPADLAKSQKSTTGSAYDNVQGRSKVARKTPAGAPRSQAGGRPTVNRRMLAPFGR